MFKIRDNVKIEDLERVGFKKTQDIGIYSIYDYETNDWRANMNIKELQPLNEDEDLNAVFLNDGLKTLYDLIKLDLVEWVGE